jgi:hypothetical protein
MASDIRRAFRAFGLETTSASRPLETQNARAVSRRAQFQLWIFSYTILVGSSKK